MAPGHTIFASNSSAFSISALGAATDRPDSHGWLALGFASSGYETGRDRQGSLRRRRTLSTPWCD